MTGAVARWTPWLLAAGVAAAYGVVGPRAGAGEGAVWRDLVAVVGDPRALGAGVAAIAAVIAAWLAIRVGGSDVAAVPGAVAAVAILAGAGPWGHAAPGTFGVGAAAVVAAIAAGERVAAGGGKWWGVACGIAIGVAIAVDRSALAVAAVVAGLLAVRLWHGARWPLIVVPVAAVAWLIASIPAWRAGAIHGVRVPDARYALDLADGVGAIAAVAAVAGVMTVVRRRSTRWTGAILAGAIAGGIAIDRLMGHPVGPVAIVGVAIAAGAGVARLARLVTIPVGQACLGGAAAVIVALPAALAAL